MLLHVAQVGLERLPVVELALVPLRDDRDLGLEPIALGHRIAGLRVGPLALGREVPAPLGGLRPARHRLLLLETEVLLEAQDALDVAAEGLHPLGHRGQLDAADGEALGQPGLVALPALEEGLQRGQVAAQAGLLRRGGHQFALQLDELGRGLFFPRPRAARSRRSASRGGA